MIAPAVAGAALGSKILFWLEDPLLTWQNLHNPAYLIGGKTIVGALIGGLITVEIAKHHIGIQQSTGDLYAIPLALGIAIGRIGCFLTGLADNTYGTPTNLPWGINFGDGIPRHPTQLYEMLFLLSLIPLLYRVLRKFVILSEASASRSEGDTQSKDPYLKKTCHFEEAGANATANRETCCSARHPSVPPSPFLPGDAFRFFMVAYMTFRLLIDFIKPYPRLFLGLGGIQWACVLIVLYYFRDVVRWLNLSSNRI